MSSTEITRARSALSRLYVYGREPSPEEVAAARARLAAAKIDRAVRESLQGIKLDESQIGGLVGSLLTCNGVDTATAAPLQRECAAAVASVAGGSDGGL